jgi:hypothetical protein
MPPIVTLLTDFGLRDPYLAEMKGVILKLCPSTVLVDVSHEIEKFNVMMGAFTLVSVVKYFPQGTINLAVVDPGVGGFRKPIIVETKRGYLVGPDNGILALAAEREGVRHVYKITSGRSARMSISVTFHGRDLFAPVAAALACGVSPDKLGSTIQDYTRLGYAKPKILKNSIACRVLYVDSFGNMITNISSENLTKIGIAAASTIEVVIGSRIFKAVKASTYSEVAEGKLIVIPDGSHGFIEIAVNQGSAAELLQAHGRSRLILKIRS